MAEQEGMGLPRQRHAQRTPSKNNGNQQGKTAGRRKPQRASLFSWGTVLVIAIVAAIVGAMAGYQLFGDRPASEVLQIGTWKHMIDLIFG